MRAAFRERVNRDRLRIGRRLRNRRRAERDAVPLQNAKLAHRRHRRAQCNQVFSLPIHRSPRLPPGEYTQPKN